MTLDELEDLAYQGQPMPELDSLADIEAYQAFRSLYGFAGQCGMSLEQGKEEKAAITQAHRVHKFLEEVQEKTNQMWKSIELAVAEYNKQPCVKNADKVMEALYGGVKRINRNEADH